MQRIGDTDRFQQVERNIEIIGADLVSLHGFTQVPNFILTNKDLTPEEHRFLRANAESLLLKQQPWQEALIKQLSRMVSLGPAEKV